MAGARGPNDPLDEETWGEVKKARKLQELFRGRFTENDARALLVHKNWDLYEAAQFALYADPPRIRAIIGNAEDGVRSIREDAVLADLARRNEIGKECRQFTCEACNKMWWKWVPSRKPVSRCHVCKQRYEPIPREREWGWAKFHCHNCARDFHGFGVRGKPTRSPCYRCHTLKEPDEILPPTRRARGADRTRLFRQSDTHTCTGQNCWNPCQDIPDQFNAQHFNQGMVPHHFHGNVPVHVPAQIHVGAVPNKPCVHPRSLGAIHTRVIEASRQHASSGSTVNTFLTQDDLMSMYQFEPSLGPVSEDGADSDSD